VTSAVTILVALPTAALVVASFWYPWAGWVALPVALACGLLAVWLGITWGGRLIDRRWPEVLASVSERVG